MNIGIVTTWFERGAAYVSKAYEQTFGKDFNVFIYARSGEAYGKGDPVWDRPNVTFSPAWSSCFYPGDSSMSRLNFYKWIKKYAIDVLLFNEQKDISIVRQFSSYGLRTGAYIDYYTEKTIPDFDVYDFVVCNTRRHYSVFKNHNNCLFIQWGTDTDVFKPPAEKNKGPTPVTFFHSAGFGGINLRKGTDILVRAFQKIEGASRLVIHSQIPVQKYGHEIANIIQRDNRIDFIKKTVTAPGLYHLGHVYVYPSKLDGIGLSVPEALSAGLPVVTTDAPPMNEFVKNDYNGLLVRVCRTNQRHDNYYWPEMIPDEDNLARKMQYYVDHPNLVEKHGKHARQSAVKNFDWKKNSKQLNSLIIKYGCAEKIKRATPLFVSKMIIQDSLRIIVYFACRFLKRFRDLLPSLFRLEKPDREKKMQFGEK